MQPKCKIIGLSAMGAAALILACGQGCKSDADSADLVEHNDMLVGMAMSQNVYNGIAAERAVYPKDFLPGSASLNELGRRRVDNLLQAYNGTTASIGIIRGDESNDLYQARIATVRKELAAAGIDSKAITVDEDGRVGGSGVASDRAILTYKRMMTDYVAKPSGSSNSKTDSQQMTDTNQKGQ